MAKNWTSAIYQHVKGKKMDAIHFHKNHIQTDDEIGFDYHGKHRHGIVLEEHWPKYFKVELENGEIKNFRYDRLDNEDIACYNDEK